MAPRDIFWFLAGLLAMTALLLAALPWLRQRASAVDAARALPRWAYAAVPLVLAGAIGIYLALGTPSATSPVTAVRAAAAAAPASGTAAPSGAMSMSSAVTGLEVRLATGGGADADWELLARSYEFLNRSADAALARKHQLPAGAGSAGATAVTAAPVSAAPLSAEALRIVEQADAARGRKEFATAVALYAQLVKQKQMNADTWADYADAQASQEHSLKSAAVNQYIGNALALNPDHAKALWLKGSLEEERSEYAAAAATLQRLLAQLPAGSENARLIGAKVQEDQRLAGGGGGASRGAAAAAGVTVSGEVLLADALRAKVRPGMTLYIVAKAVGVPGAPVAVYRTTTAGWPLKFELSDANAMLPGHNLSSSAQVVVEARISLSGLANSQPGDLLGSSQPLAPAGSKPLRIVIQKVVG